MAFVSTVPWSCFIMAYKMLGNKYMQHGYDNYIRGVLDGQNYHKLTSYLFIVAAMFIFCLTISLKHTRKHYNIHISVCIAWTLPATGEEYFQFGRKLRRLARLMHIYLCWEMLNTVRLVENNSVVQFKKAVFCTFIDPFIAQPGHWAYSTGEFPRVTFGHAHVGFGHA